MKKIIFSIVILSSLQSHAQNEVDALRYSWIQYGGTARYNSVAGAFNSIGGDMSCISTNPAGLARFTKSEFTFSLGQHSSNANTTFYNTANSDSKNWLHVSNFGVLLAARSGLSGSWKSAQFAFAYNRLANYSERITIYGTNMESSLATAFIAEANGIDENVLRDTKPFSSGLAYWAYLIDPIPPGNNTYSSDLEGGNVIQSRTIDREGGYNESAFSFSGNYDDKIYLGFTFGMPSIRFDEVYNHYEKSLDTAHSVVNFNYVYNLTTRGRGINAKFGAIFVPIDFIRFGLAVHTPTAINFTDTWNSGISVNFDDGDVQTANSENGLYNYRLRTPGRFIASVSLLAFKSGFVSAEYEMVDYGSSRFRAERFSQNPYNFNSENEAIRNNYRSTSNLRFGTEWRIKPIYVRGGYALYGSPFKPDKTISKPQRYTYSGGIGYRSPSNANGVSFYIDFGLAVTQWDEDYYMYSPSLVQAALVNNRLTTWNCTLGFRF
jgi:hypothetical protein